MTANLCFLKTLPNKIYNIILHSKVFLFNIFLSQVKICIPSKSFFKFPPRISTLFLACYTFSSTSSIQGFCFYKSLSCQRYKVKTTFESCFFFIQAFKHQEKLACSLRWKLQGKLSLQRKWREGRNCTNIVINFQDTVVLFSPILRPLAIFQIMLPR